MTTTIYRASDRNTASCGACFAADEDDAAAYLDNQGYGGGKLYALTVDVDMDTVLSLVDGRLNGVPHGREARDAWTQLASALGVAEDGVRDLRDQYEQRIEAAVDSKRVRAKLRAAGFEWVVYEDTFPAACVTWVYLGTDTLTLESAS